MNRYLSEKIKKMEEYVPNEGEFAVRLDANESPYGLPGEVGEDVVAAVTSACYNRYPDPMAKGLIAAFGKVYDLDTDNIVAGNGSDELISLICTAFLTKGDKVLFLAPDFSMYAFYSGLIEAEVLTVEKEDKRFIDFEALKNTVKEQNIRMVIFSNPCNPTGVVYDKRVMTDFVANSDCLCVVDEAYMEFCSDIPGCSVLHEVENYQNLIVLKTLSKAFGLAALRLGFAVACKELIGALRKTKSPYNVNSISQAIGEVVLKKWAVIEARVDEVKKNTRCMHQRFASLSEKLGYTVYPTDTNFNVLRYPTPATAKTVFEALAAKGIAVRYTMGDCLRITCGTEEENERLLTALCEIGKVSKEEI